jgi:hypothetical protein
MARFPIILLLAAVVLGCNASSKSTASRTPAPNFNGPTIARATNPAPIPRQPNPSPQLSQAQRTFPGIPREWIPYASPRPWRFIVIHHSATESGSAAQFDRAHRDKGWDELGYHFVIGNGRGARDGLVEVGPRWPRQKWGAHAKTPDNQYNDYGIGICLVGNFDHTRLTAAQEASLARLVAYLMHTYKIPASRVIGHNDTGRSTDCPGKNVSIARIRAMSSRMLAESEVEHPSFSSQTAHTADLLRETR